MTLQQFLDWFKSLVETLAPAIAVMFWNYEQVKKDELKHEALDAKVNLELEKNHETVEEKYSGKSDLDVINDAISSDAGQPRSGSKTN